MQKQRSFREYLTLVGKGMMMGASDAVPGVSGGTIAFITGIYEELIFSLKQCGPKALAILFKQGPKAAWAHVNGSFLLTLIAGILGSLLAFSHIILYWLANYPEILWSFFFGLILASVWSVIQHVSHWNSNVLTAFAIGTIAAYVITSFTPASIEATPIAFFLSGVLAICAMILPGISGSFILLLLGMYNPILTAITSLQIEILSIFALGCVIGLLSFSHVLSWMFSTYKTTTLALLGGFLLGSLNKVWPWKYTTAYTIDRHGEQVPLVQENVLPTAFESLTGQPSYILYGIGAMLLGAIVVLFIQRMGSKDGV